MKNQTEDLKIKVKEYLNKLNDTSTQNNAFLQLKNLLQNNTSNEDIKIIFPLLLNNSNENASKLGKEYQLILIAYAISIYSIKVSDNDMINKILESINIFIIDNSFNIHKAASVVILEIYDQSENKEKISEFIFKFFFNSIDKNHNIIDKIKDNGILNGSFIIINDLLNYILYDNSDIDSIQKSLIPLIVELLNVFKKYKYPNQYLLQSISQLIDILPYDEFKNNFIEIIPLLINVLYENDPEIYLSKIEVCSIFSHFKNKLQFLKIEELPNQNEIIKSLEYLSQDKILKVQVASKEALNNILNIKEDNNKIHQKDEKRLSKLNLLRNLSKINKDKDPITYSKEIRNKIYEVGIDKFLKKSGFRSDREEEENLIQIKKDLAESRKTSKSKEKDKKESIQDFKKNKKHKKTDKNFQSNNKYKYDEKNENKVKNNSEEKMNQKNKKKIYSPIKKSLTQNQDIKNSIIKDNLVKKTHTKTISMSNSSQKNLMNEIYENEEFNEESSENENNKVNIFSIENKEITGDEGIYKEDDKQKKNNKIKNNKINMEEENEFEEEEENMENRKSKKKKLNKDSLKEVQKKISKNSEKKKKDNNNFKNKLNENKYYEDIESDTEDKKKEEENSKENIKKGKERKKKTISSFNNSNNEFNDEEQHLIQKNNSYNKTIIKTEKPINLNSLFEKFTKKFNEILDDLSNNFEQEIDNKISFLDNRVNKLKQKITNTKTNKTLKEILDNDMNENSSIWKVILRYLKNENYEQAYIKALSSGDDLIFLRLIFITGTNHLKEISYNTNKRIIIRLNQIQRCFMIQQQMVNFVIEFYNLNMLNLEIFNENELNDLMQTLSEIGINEDEIGNSARLIYDKIKESFQENNRQLYN